MSECKKELISLLKQPAKKVKVVAMPDLFLDRLVDLNCTAKNFSTSIAEIAKRTGGSTDGIQQMDIRGGNAVNVASALAALGADATPIVCTSQLGLKQLRFHLAKYRMDTSHVKTKAKASITTALEFKTDGGKANVMLRDLGSLADFSPADLNEGDYAAVEEADYVCLFNWAGTRKFGTALAEAVFRRAKKRSNCKTYFGTADPTPNKEKIPELMEKILKSPNVDILSVNENEAVTYASLLGAGFTERRKRKRFGELALDAARVLAAQLSARIDLHTTAFSATVTRDSEFVVPAFHVEVLRATGAGDAWDAGNIVGDANALSDECRLTLANAVAACYLSDVDGAHPTRQRLIRFLGEKGKPKF